MKNQTLEEIRSSMPIRFSYNGDLGRLQHTTSANLQQVETLSRLGVIQDAETYHALLAEIQDYFVEEIGRCVQNPGFYIR